MNKSAALAIRYGIALARQEAAEWYYNRTVYGDVAFSMLVADMNISEERIRQVVRKRYRAVSHDALKRERTKSLARAFEKYQKVVG